MKPLISIIANMICLAPEKAVFIVGRKDRGVEDDRRPRLKGLFILQRDTGIDEVDAANVAVRRFGNIAAVFYVPINGCYYVPDFFPDLKTSSAFLMASRETR